MATPYELFDWQVRCLDIYLFYVYGRECQKKQFIVECGLIGFQQGSVESLLRCGGKKVEVADTRLPSVGFRS